MAQPKTDATANVNRGVATDFLEMVVSRRIKEAYDKHVSPGMMHHNPYYPADAASLRRGMEEAHAKFPDTTIRIVHAVAEGEYVAVHSHVTHEKGEPGVAVVHLFRFDERGKIVELWDVGQPVPSESPNQSGMF